MNDPTVDMTDDQLAAHYAELDAEDQARKAKLEAPDALARAARWYAANGIAVFPLRPGSKAPLIAKAHPKDDRQECRRACGQDGHGLYDATTNLERVDAWWHRTPQANIGLPTGHLFDVIDIDGPAGIRSYADLLVHGACPDACCATSHCPGDGTTLADFIGPAGILARALTRGDNGGQHLYVAPSGDGNTTAMLPGIDYRGVGGYVVAPPSRCRLGRYAWIEPLDPAALIAATAA